MSYRHAPFGCLTLVILVMCLVTPPLLQALRILSQNTAHSPLLSPQQHIAAGFRSSLAANGGRYCLPCSRASCICTRSTNPSSIKSNTGYHDIKLSYLKHRTATVILSPRPPGSSTLRVVHVAVETTLVVVPGAPFRSTRALLSPICKTTTLSAHLWSHTQLY